MAKFTMTTGPKADSDDVHDELQRIAGMIADGFTSGEVDGGWWSVDDLADNRALSDDLEE